MPRSTGILLAEMTDVRFVIELVRQPDGEDAVERAAAVFALQGWPVPEVSRVFADGGGDAGLERFHEFHVDLPSAALPRAAFDLAYRLLRV